MSEQADRFECILEPTNEWMVWDKARGLPAEFSAITLVGLRRTEATSLCWLLNEAAGAETRKSQAS